jgi:hypothetical protein
MTGLDLRMHAIATAAERLGATGNIGLQIERSLTAFGRLRAAGGLGIGVHDSLLQGRARSTEPAMPVGCDLELCNTNILPFPADRAGRRSVD